MFKLDNTAQSYFQVYIWLTDSFNNIYAAQIPSTAAVPFEASYTNGIQINGTRGIRKISMIFSVIDVQISSSFFTSYPFVITDAGVTEMQWVYSYNMTWQPFAFIDVKGC